MHALRTRDHDLQGRQRPAILRALQRRSLQPRPSLSSETKPMNLLGAHINAFNFAIGYSLIVLAAGFELDRQVHLRSGNSDSMATLIAIVNVVGVWLGLCLQKAIP